MDAPEEEPPRRGTLRVPVLPRELAERPAEPVPYVPVLKGPVRRTRRPAGAAIWLAVLAAAGIAVAVVLIADPFADGRHHRSGRIAKPARPAPRAAPAVSWGGLEVTTLPSLPVSAAGAAALADGDRVILAAGGVLLSGPVSGPWRRRAGLPAALSAPAAVAAGGSIWLLGGERGGRPTDALVRIGPRSHRGVRAGRFEEPLAEAGFASADGTLYLAGGWTGTTAASAVLRVRPPNAVRLVARLPAAVRAPAVALVGSRLVVAGGRGARGPTRLIVAVDLETGRVTRLGRLPQPVSGAVLVRIGSSLYLLGGAGPRGAPARAVVRIDPRSGRAVTVGRSTVALPDASGVTAGGAALLFVGRTAYRLSA